MKSGKNLSHVGDVQHWQRVVLVFKKTWSGKRRIKKRKITKTKNSLSFWTEIVEISIPHLNNAIHAYYIISSAEASSNLARFDGVRFGKRAENYSDITELYKNSRSNGFGKEVKRRIMTGAYVLSEGQRDRYYQKAIETCEYLKAEYENIFTETES